MSQKGDDVELQEELDEYVDEKEEEEDGEEEEDDDEVLDPDDFGMLKKMMNKKNKIEDFEYLDQDEEEYGEGEEGEGEEGEGEGEGEEGEEEGEGRERNDFINDDFLKEEEDDEEEEDGQDAYLQKLNDQMNKQYIMETHPEKFIHNYEEVKALTHIIRDDNGNILDPLHRTSPFITKYEKTRILGMRAKQINAGAQPFVQVPVTMIDGYLIAELELKEKKIPFVLRRPLPNGTFEYWSIKDLEFIH
jgi:DNA-directed RNA polymerase I, II, and III subunit RPABC2